MPQTRKTSPARSGGNQRDRSNGRVSRAQIQAQESDAEVPIEEVVAEAEQRAQAEFEGVEPDEHITFEGERFRLARKVSYLPLLKFAHYASKGTDSASMQGMAAMYEMLQSCFDRGQPCEQCVVCLGDDEADPPVKPKPRACETRTGDEWPRFEEHALDVGADDEDLFAVVSRVIELVSARPTQRRSESSPRAPLTSARSKAASRLPPGAQDLLTVNELAR